MDCRRESAQDDEEDEEPFEAAVRFPRRKGGMRTPFTFATAGEEEPPPADDAAGEDDDEEEDEEEDPSSLPVDECRVRNAADEGTP